jgi:hypothetical protein
VVPQGAKEGEYLKEKGWWIGMLLMLFGEVRPHSSLRVDVSDRLAYAPPLELGSHPSFSDW